MNKYLETRRDKLKPGDSSIPDADQYDYMIQTLAKEHGQSIKVIETEYTVVDFWKLIYKQSLEAPENAGNGQRSHI